MKKAQFLVSHFDAGVERYKAGEVYPLDDETARCIVRGSAVEVDVPDEPAAETKAAEGETKVAEGETAAVAAETPAAEPKVASKAKK